MLHWLRADDGVGLTGSEVDAWVDKVSGSVTFSNTGTNRPTYSSSGFNGTSRPYLNFAKASSQGLRTTGLSAASGPRTIAVVHKPVAAAATNETLFDSQTGRIIALHLTSTAGQVGKYDNTSGFQNAGAASAVAQCTIYVFGATGAGTGAVYRNGVQVGSALASTVKAVGGTCSVGTDYLGTSPYDGQIAEQLGWNVAFAAAEVAAFYAYASARYGV